MSRAKKLNRKLKKMGSPPAVEFSLAKRILKQMDQIGSENMSRARELQEKLSQTNEKISLKDELLQGITFEELVDTVISNEKVKDEKAVRKVFKEILKNTLADAEFELKKNMKDILKELK